LDFTSLLISFIQRRTQLGNIDRADLRALVYGLSLTFQALPLEDSVTDSYGTVSNSSLHHALLDVAEEFRESGFPELRRAADLALAGEGASAIMWRCVQVITRPQREARFNDAKYFEPQEMFVPTSPVPEGSVEDLLAQLTCMTGLTRVKESVIAESASLRSGIARGSKGLAVPQRNRHMIFRGNPGTGKTTVARLIAGIYLSMGILDKNEMVEVDRSGLVAQWVGKTALRVNDVIDEALGGVLFIDEAHALAGSHAQGADRFAQEAVDVLVKRMEDDRDDLVVILAGYPAEMEHLLAMNPGLASRIGTSIEFDDYTDEELIDILRAMMDQSDYDLSTTGEELVARRLHGSKRGASFGNARLMRNVFERATRSQAVRLDSELGEASITDLRTLTEADIQVTLDAVLPRAHRGPNLGFGATSAELCG
jgi:Holliday junction resolvasome RuvABC ATP-dependent DNA helicase subunit